MSGVWKKLLLVAALLVGLAIAAFFYWVADTDRRRGWVPANPCESGCLNDSGGLDDCRKLCVNHPMTYP